MRKIWKVLGVLAVSFLCMGVGQNKAQAYYGTGLESCKISISGNRFNYTGKAICPTVTITAKDGTVLQKDVDYTVGYENNINYGVGRIVILGANDYQGQYCVKKFGILPKQVTGVKVSSPYYMENTVKWNATPGADGYYIYRKQGSGAMKYIANITDGHYRVFHDKNPELKANTTYAYQVVAYVADPNPYEDEVRYGTYYSPSSVRISQYDYDAYKFGRSYYASYKDGYYPQYDYSCYTGACVSAYTAQASNVASGKVTTSSQSKRVAKYTSDPITDYLANTILTKNIKVSTGSGRDAAVKKIYNWMVKNCNFTKSVKSEANLKNMKKYLDYTSANAIAKANSFENQVMQKIYSGDALCIGYDWHDVDRAHIAMAYRKGSCSFLTPMFNVLCNAIGVDAYIIDGFYVNKDKSKMYHNWSLVKQGKYYYWYDAPVACRPKNKKYKKLWYKKGTKYWKTCHKWSSSLTRRYTDGKIKK